MILMFDEEEQDRERGPRGGGRPLHQVREGEAHADQWQQQPEHRADQQLADVEIEEGGEAGVIEPGWGSARATKDIKRRCHRELLGP